MPLLGPDDAEAIRRQLADRLRSDVTLSLVAPSALEPPDRDLTPQIRQLYEELAALSPRIRYEYLEAPTPEQRVALALAGDDAGPITVVSGAARGKVRFWGAPAGHEFPGLLEALAAVSTGESGLSESSRSALRQIARPVHIKVFFTPT